MQIGDAVTPVGLLDLEYSMPKVMHEALNTCFRILSEGRFVQQRIYVESRGRVGAMLVNTGEDNEVLALRIAIQKLEVSELCFVSEAFVTIMKRDAEGTSFTDEIAEGMFRRDGLNLTFQSARNGSRAYTFLIEGQVGEPRQFFYHGDYPGVDGRLSGLLEPVLRDEIEPGDRNLVRKMSERIYQRLRPQLVGR